MCKNVQIYTVYTINIFKGDKSKYNMPSYNRKQQQTNTMYEDVVAYSSEELT
uniref:Uncharacterized protein n=1 Tax=Arundo donax TaxID=35708 RepID=A0A0A9GGP1_ARUDO